MPKGQRVIHNIERQLRAQHGYDLALDPRSRLDASWRPACRARPAGYVLTAQMPDDDAGMITGGQRAYTVFRETDFAQFARRVTDVLRARRLARVAERSAA